MTGPELHDKMQALTATTISMTHALIVDRAHLLQWQSELIAARNLCWQSLLNTTSPDPVEAAKEIEKRVEDEREACARIADCFDTPLDPDQWNYCARKVAREIRRRNNPVPSTPAPDRDAILRREVDWMIENGDAGHREFLTKARNDSAWDSVSVYLEHGTYDPEFQCQYCAKFKPRWSAALAEAERGGAKSE